MTTPIQPFTDIPTVAPGTPATQVQPWFFLRRTQVEGLAKQLTPRSDFDRAKMEALATKMRRLEARLAQGGQADAVTAEFRDWVSSYSNDEGAWDYYKDWQKQQDKAAQEAQAKAAAEKALNEAKDRASGAALGETRKRSKGLMASSGEYGRVIAGLAIVGNPAMTFFGFSGIDMHTASVPAVSQVITELLRGTNQAEKWPQQSCAEVDALKKYLGAAGITSAAAIPVDTLVFHAEVWNPGGTWGGKTTSPRWQPRGACANCKQWVGKIGARLA